VEAEGGEGCRRDWTAGVVRGSSGGRCVSGGKMRMWMEGDEGGGRRRESGEGREVKTY